MAASWNGVFRARKAVRKVMPIMTGATPFDRLVGRVPTVLQHLQCPLLVVIEAVSQGVTTLCHKRSWQWWSPCTIKPRYTAFSSDFNPYLAWTANLVTCRAGITVVVSALYLPCKRYQYALKCTMARQLELGPRLYSMLMLNPVLRLGCHAQLRMFAHGGYKTY